MKIVKFLIREIKEIALVTLFFFISFGLILLLMKLFLASYSVDIYIFSKILICSLVAAKVVIIIDKMNIVKKMENKPRYLIVSYKTFFYTLTVLSIGILEKLFDAYKETKALHSAIIMVIQNQNLTHFLAVILCLAIVFSIYNFIDEVNQYLGKGELYRLFFSGIIDKQQLESHSGE